MSAAVLSVGCADGEPNLSGGEPVDTDSRTDDDEETGSTSIDPTGVDPTGVDPTDATDPTSADETGGCGGCLDDAGTCLEGGDDAACGVLGEACVACEGAEVCDEGACVEPPACSPDNCDGCCDGDTCVDGGVVDACGAGGGQCSTCPSGATCEDGTCVLACEDVCGGCCDGETCIELDDQSAVGCGVNGASCEGCPDGFACEAGECISTACAASCDGCCDGDTCLDGDDPGACGVDGATCDACGSNLTCGATGCEPDPMAMWDITVVDGIVPLTDADGDAWDSFNGLPEPYVVLTVVGASGETAYIDDELFPEWNELVLSGVNSVQLEGGLEVAVMDSDLGFDTTIGECLLLPNADFYNGETVWTCEDAEGYQLWQLTLSVAPSAG